MKKCFIVMLSVLLISACSSRYATNGENVYMNSQNGRIVAVPPPLTSENISHFYDLPAQNQNPAVSIEPPMTQPQ